MEVKEREITQKNDHAHGEARSRLDDRLTSHAVTVCRRGVTSMRDVTQENADDADDCITRARTKRNAIEGRAECENDLL
jgi:hypothetical protein